MKINTITVDLVEIDNEEYLRFCSDTWMKLHGESFEPVYYYHAELEKIYQESL